MKPSEAVKRVGLKSLKEAAELSQTTANGLSIMKKYHPEKFLCIIAGAAAVKNNPDMRELIQDE